MSANRHRVTSGSIGCDFFEGLSDKHCRHASDIEWRLIIGLVQGGNTAGSDDAGYPQLCRASNALNPFQLSSLMISLVTSRYNDAHAWHEKPKDKENKKRWTKMTSQCVGGGKRCTSIGRKKKLNTKSLAII